MRIKMKSVMAGPDGTAYPGQEIAVPDAKGRDLVSGGYATEIVPPAAVPVTSAPETADAPPAETPESLTEAELERATAPDAPETADVPRAKKGRKGR